MYNKDQYYTGVIKEITDPVFYKIKVDIPGIVEDVSAFPMRGEIDEPRVGDFVLLRSLDPVFNSYFLYQKLKENDYIGFRSNGKMVDITPDYITIGIFSDDSEKEGYNDRSENTKEAPDGSLNKEKEIKSGGFRPIPTDWVTLYKDGSLDISLRANSTINIAKDSSITIGGNCTLNVTGDATVKSPNITVEGEKVTITGGKLITKGTSDNKMDGPFNCLKNCAFSGVPHSGSEVSGT